MIITSDDWDHSLILSTSKMFHHIPRIEATKCSSVEILE